ncbi:hypothetical protein MZO42_19545 [Sphingomonas psychrotolerans]|uniref:Uncharacterized protein n=1 Tax=Sphingomonas psychrotolerans TaxID=1327635 RepID=A0ABU3N8Q8_9SPHN|nr:hypothetical protein [Sphingomonas psychrotolerans]MDT8760900.1 hypothetical protein [Sphingomonas psychrotolerans]
MIVNLHIDRLVLDGLPMRSHERPLIQAAVEAELTRLIARDHREQALPPGHGGALSIPHTGDPTTRSELLGIDIGEAIFAHLQPRLQPHPSTPEQICGPGSGRRASPLSRESSR